MAKSNRYHKNRNTTPISNISSPDENRQTNISKQISNGEFQNPLSLMNAGNIDSLTGGLGQNNLLIVDTDQQIALQLEDNLFTKRKKRINAILGEQSELVNIVVQTYNRLEKVKNCIECILKYTTEIDYELILFDNGSTDGTLEYLKSIQHPRKRIIQYTRNVGNHLPYLFNQVNGRYIAYINSDIYVTKNWLKNLLTCLKSDDTIGMVIPVFSNASNYQGADITFTSLDEMQEKAAKYNISDPRLWLERVRLINPASLFKREALEMIGMVDYGFLHDFSDDDITFRLRRAGYKAILCKDTFVHHDHFRTNLSEEENKNFKQSIEAGKKDFQSKYFGIDAWEDVNNYELTMMSFVNPMQYKGRSEVDILGVDVLCGTPILELKNKLREAELYNTRLSAFSTDAKYWLDLKTICAGEVIVDRIESFREYFQNMQFDYIVLGKPINFYSRPLDLLLDLLKHIKNDGHILLKLRNTFDAITAFKALGVSIQVDNFTDQIDHVYQLSITELIDATKNQGYLNNKVAAENWPLDKQVQDKFRSLIMATGFVKNPDEVCNLAMVRDYIIDIIHA